MSQRPDDSRRPRLRNRRGFTLVEILLVVAIIGITSMIAMPSFVRSIRGNRLRSATRSVVMGGRYARSMALLVQQPVALAFDLGKATFSVDAMGGAAPAVPAADFGATGSVARALEPAAPGDEASAAQPPMPPERVHITRTLDGITVESVKLAEQEGHVEGRILVVYQPNGRCTPYEVNLRDEAGSRVRIQVDALSTATTEREP